MLDIVRNRFQRSSHGSALCNRSRDLIHKLFDTCKIRHCKSLLLFVCLFVVVVVGYM